MEAFRGAGIQGLPREVVEKMRQAYTQAAAKHLETLAQPTIGKNEVVNTGNGR